MVNVAVMVPVVMYALERLARRGGAGNICLAGISVALTLLAGQPEIALYLLSMASLYYFLRLYYYRDARGAGRGLFDFLIFVVFALFLSAPLLLPFLELWANAHHIHQAGGPMGAQALPAWNRILPIITPSATEIIQDPSMVAGLCPLVPFGFGYFFRFLPVNGVWDSLGGLYGCASLAFGHRGAFCLPEKLEGVLERAALFLLCGSYGDNSKKYRYQAVFSGLVLCRYSTRSGRFAGRGLSGHSP